MNVLLTSAGRRAYMVEYFRRALQPLGGRVLCANSHPRSSAMVMADRGFVVPRVDHEEYIPTLLRICQEESVRLVVPLFDIDLPFLAAAKPIFHDHGVQVCVSSPEVVRIANDKWETYRFLETRGLDTPRSHLDQRVLERELSEGLMSFPIMVKPRWGMGSIGVMRAEDREQLRFFGNHVRRIIGQSYLDILSREDLDRAVIFQQFVAGAEYGLDVLHDLEGRLATVVVKRKLEMRSGETDSAVTVADADLASLGRNLGELLGHVGNLDVDVLRDESGGPPKILEINARFGGGYPFSHLAGVDFPRALISWARGETVEPTLLAWRPNVFGLKSIQLLDGGEAPFM